MVDRDNMLLWIEALESGEYLRGEGQLGYLGNDGKQYLCCLGVVCETAIAAGVPVVKEVVNASLRYDDQQCSLPLSVREWLGTEAVDPVVYQDPKDVITCIGANDIRGWSFQQIAAELRKTYIDGQGDAVDGDTDNP